MRKLDQAEVKQHIDSFNRIYHQGFRKVRSQARDWLAGEAATPPDALVKSVQGVLAEWGAGRRRAPKVPASEKLAGALRNSFTILKQIENLRLFDVPDSGARAAQGVGDAEKIVAALRLLGDSFRPENSDRVGATYPTKLLLLLTGRMIALDSNVRASLQHEWNLAGLAFAQPSVLPRSDTDEAVIKHAFIATVDFLRENEEAIRAGVQASQWRELLGALDAPARIADIVLFQLAKERRDAAEAQERRGAQVAQGEPRIPRRQRQQVGELEEEQAMHTSHRGHLVGSIVPTMFTQWEQAANLWVDHPQQQQFLAHVMAGGLGGNPINNPAYVWTGLRALRLDQQPALGLPDRASRLEHLLDHFPMNIHANDLPAHLRSAFAVGWMAERGIIGSARQRYLVAHGHAGTVNAASAVTSTGRSLGRYLGLLDENDMPTAAYSQFF